MNKRTRTSLFGALLLFGAAGCADLDVVNPNDPARGGALVTAGDVQSLVIGSYHSWYESSHSANLLPISNMSFQHVAPWANFGMYKYSLFPRNELINSPADPDYAMINFPWTRNYRAISSAAEGLRVISDPESGVADQLGGATVQQTNAFGKFVLALAHASIGVMYDQGFIVDETTQLLDESGQPIEQEVVSAAQVMDAAFGYFQEAIDLANAGGFSIPADWMQTPDDVPAAEFARLAHSYRAAFRASSARTPDDRAQVDWNAVLADVDAAVEEDFIQNQDYYAGWYNQYLDYGSWGSWQQLPNFIYGMADQSGNYQTWLDTPLAEREPVIDGKDIIFITPDQRYPQGSTLVEQEDNPGSKLEINWARGSSWAQAARGTWRWSYYRSHEWDSYNSWSDFHTPEVERVELDLLAAEAHYWLGNAPEAAAIVNQTRTAAGLNATDAAGTNTSCVPKLPNGGCGDLLEMLKWEKRLETWQTGMVYGNSWYFDARRWGDLYAGTVLEFPIPGGELQTLFIPAYTFGGVGGESAAPVSSYNFPDEG